jgi:glycosyltransferase involved in cell wall biosynthesis
MSFWEGDAMSSAAEHPPTVSIGLPVHNGEDYLAEAVESILAQTYGDFELIICDNASTDRTEAICRRYQERDPRIRYHRQPQNLGACANYDMTFHLSRGTYFKWAAHDDVLAPTFLERCVEVLDDDDGCDLVHPRTIIIDGDGREVLGYLDAIALDSEDPAERLAHWMLFDPDGLCNPVFGLMRRDAMAETALHGDYPQSDRVFLAAMALGGRCQYVDEALFYRRLHGNNSTRAHPDQRQLKVWYTGRRPRWPVFPLWRLFAEFTRAVRRSSMPRRQQARAYRVVLAWASLKRRALLRELVVIYYLNGHHTALGRAGRRLARTLRGRGDDERVGLWQAVLEQRPLRAEGGAGSMEEPA